MVFALVLILLFYILSIFVRMEGNEMLEFLAFPLVALAVAILPSGGASDKKKIGEIFENVGYGVKKKTGFGEHKKDVFITPRFVKKQLIKDGEDEIGIKYLFTVPRGLPASKMKKFEEEMSIFSDGLQKPVIIEFKKLTKESAAKYLHVNVYDRDIPEIFPYEKVQQKEYKEGEKKEWIIPLGMALEGLIWHNFDHIPHMTLAGVTRFGKTVFLRMLMTYLIEVHGDDVEFYIIDLKGGLEFNKYKSIRQVKAVSSNSDEALELLRYLTNQDPNEGESFGLLEHEFEYFRKKGISNIVDTNIKRRRFIIVDEGAQLTPDRQMKKSDAMKLIECQSKLSRLAAVGGALGYRLVFATQYPTADTLPRQVKQNADAKISFRLPSDYASKVAIDTTGAEELPSDFKGRALFKTHELKEVQTPFLTHDEMWERLEKYQIPVPLEGEVTNVVEETNSSGGNLVEFR